MAALAAAAGLSYGSFNPDPGMDLGLVDRSTAESILLQIKTSTAPRYVNGVLQYDLDVKHYEYLRKVTTIRRYLVVMDVRKNQHEWVACMDWAYLLRHRAYYCSLQGKPSSSNRATVAVSVPNLLTPQALRQMIEIVT